MKKTNWKTYGSLAWTEAIISSPEEYKTETEVFCKLIKEYSKCEPITMLHLGCGAGFNDWIFKNHFQVSGVDISENMLRLARELNPELTYICEDMRSIRLENRYDVVAIPDSIGYMTTLEDLHQVLRTAFLHLKPGGIFLVVTLIKKDFRDNNFVYSGLRGDIKVTIFENNTIPQKTKTNYEATFIYLIRKRGKLKVYTDCHIIGLYSLQVWHDQLAEAGFILKHQQTGHFYDGYLLGEGEYPLTIFTCIKPPK